MGAWPRSLVLGIWVGAIGVLSGLSLRVKHRIFRNVPPASDDMRVDKTLGLIRGSSRGYAEVQLS